MKRSLVFATLVSFTIFILSTIFLTNLIFKFSMFLLFISFLATYIFILLKNEKLYKLEKNLFLFPEAKTILLTFGDENSNVCYNIPYTKKWLKEIKFMKKRNSKIKISISSGIYKKDNKFYVRKNKEFEPRNFYETEKLVNKIMCDS